MANHITALERASDICNYNMSETPTLTGGGIEGGQIRFAAAWRKKKIRLKSKW